MRLEVADASSVEVVALVQRYVAHVQSVTGVSRQHPALDIDHGSGSTPSTYLLARSDDGTPVGCGGVRLITPTTAEVERLWVDPAARGRRLGHTLLRSLEEHALRLGAARGVLETRAELSAARRLYDQAGWTPIPRYRQDTPATHWFGKRLLPEEPTS